MNGNTRRKGRSEYSGAYRDFYHISFSSECQLCFETCEKPRRLPCEHEFCKACLAGYFERNIRNEDHNPHFPCPSCNKSTVKPALSKSKWTKAFKLDKRTLFYTDGLFNAEEKGAIVKHLENSSSGKSPSLEFNNVSRRATTHGKPSPREVSKRSAVHFTGVHQRYPGFNTTISTDDRECVYWGGTILRTGHIVLPDFYNSCVKVFTVYGNHVYHAKIPKRPFDLTEIHDSTIVVSHGAWEKAVTFLSYSDNHITNTGSIPIDGHLYSVTRRSKQCVGIFETPEGKIKLVSITTGGCVTMTDPGEVSIFLSTGSQIQFNETDNLYYFTEKRNLLCTDTSFNILFLKSYPYLETDHYILGSVSLNPNGTIFVGSDMCVLRIDTDGNLQGSPIPTKIDPFHIMVTADGTKLILVGRSNRVLIYMPPQE